MRAYGSTAKNPKRGTFHKGNVSSFTNSIRIHLKCLSSEMSHNMAARSDAACGISTYSTTAKGTRHQSLIWSLVVRKYDIRY